jgi:hypothetical protein
VVLKDGTVHSDRAQTPTVAHSRAAEADVLAEV